jgi:hypothetical protein
VRPGRAVQHAGRTFHARLYREERQRRKVLPRSVRLALLTAYPALLRSRAWPRPPVSLRR